MLLFRLDDFYEKTVIILYSLIIIFGVIGNLAVVLAFITNKVKVFFTINCKLMRKAADFRYKYNYENKIYLSPATM